MKLNQATAMAMNGSSSGIEEKLAIYDTKIDLPDVTSLSLPVDPRKKEEDYFNEKVRAAVSFIFESRSHAEKSMTREELVAFDRELIHRFTPTHF